MNGEIVLYQPEGEVRLEVRMEKESVWLSQMQMADLFQKDRTVIGRHIKNIYKEGELAKDITCANFATTPRNFRGLVKDYLTTQGNWSQIVTGSASPIKKNANFAS